VTQYGQDTNVLIDLFANYQTFLDIVSSGSSLTLALRKKIIIETFKGNVDKYLLNFFLLLVEQRHFRYVRLILKEFRKLCNEYYDIHYGIIYSVIPLSDQQIKKIKSKIEKIVNHKLEVVNKLDPSLIGGIKIKVNNQVFDGSIKGQIEQLKGDLLHHE